MDMICMYVRMYVYNFILVTSVRSTANVDDDSAPLAIQPV